MVWCLVMEKSVDITIVTKNTSNSIILKGAFTSLNVI